MLKSGCYHLSADRIVAPNGLHAYMMRRDFDDLPVASTLGSFGERRNINMVIFILPPRVSMCDHFST